MAALLQVQGLSFGYGATVLFQEISFVLNSNERAALVAPNGAGKSTLLRLIAGELKADAGVIALPKTARLAYSKQSHELDSAGTVKSALLSGFREELALRAEIQELERTVTHGNTDVLMRLAELQERYHHLEGDQLERRVEMIATHLGFSEEAMERPQTSLSGGERGRLELGMVLAQQADLLLLDEPTNHLDIETIAWLEEYLLSYKGSILCVSHDRRFLDNVCPHTFELGRRSFRSYPLKYTDYEVARAEDLERERQLLERQEAFVEKTEDFIRRNIAGQKTKQAQSRRKMLDKLERLEGPEDVWARAEKLAFRFVEATRSGDLVLEAKGLAATRGGKKLFSGLDLLLKRGDRLGIVGPNGTGKTTLLKALAGLNPADAGELRLGSNVLVGYFDQKLGELDPEKTAVEEIRSVRGEMNVDAARAYLARFRFYGDDTLRRIAGFSGGERSRVALAKLLLEPRNLLFLDEPTNHLDIPAAEILEEGLKHFPGTVVLVSHDRVFLEAITTRILSLEAGEIQFYPGNYRDFCLLKTGALQKTETAREEPDGSEKRRVFENEKAQQRALERKRKRVGELEKQIQTTEQALAVLRKELRDDAGGHWEKLAEKAAEEQNLSKALDIVMEEWLLLSEELAS